METAAQQMIGSYSTAAPDKAISADNAVVMIPGGQEALALAANAYRKEHLLNLTPVQVIKKLYDTAILACKKNNAPLAQRAITQLILGLNFDYEEMAVGLFGLYQYSKECIRKGDNAGAAAVLEELRSAWIQAFHL